MTTGMIDTFKSRVNEGGGLAMGNLYRVFLPPVIGVQTQDMDILCKSTQIPKTTTINRKIYGYDNYESRKWLY